MPKSFTKQGKVLFEAFSLDGSSIRFKKYLSQQVKSKKTKSKSLVLVEFEQSPENVLALSFFLPILLERFDSRMVAYQLTRHKKLRKIIKKIQYRFSTTSKLIGKKLISINLDDSNNSHRYNEIWEEIQTPEALEKFEYLGIRIGDLIYDEYLAKFRMHTLDLNDRNLKEIFVKAVSYLEWWIEFVKKASIDAVIVSHDVYLFGVPARLAVSRGIPVFLVSTTEIVRLNQTYPRVGADIPLYPELFKAQELNFRAKGIATAKERIHNRIKGVGPSDLNYFPVVAFSEVQTQRNYLEINNNRKILVAAHDFYDSPHGGQIHLYPDFYLWLIALSEIAKVSNYDWYIKTHPYLRGSGREILAKFVSNNPKFKLLPPEATHNEIILEGIELALTVTGTIATEYPLLGVQVLNASGGNPHAGYNFSVTPISRQQYESYLKNIDSIPPIANTEQIYEYYFMRHLLPVRNWLFVDESRYRKETGFGVNPMTRKIYDYFLHEENLVPQEEIYFAMRRFLESDAYQLGREHFRIDVNPIIYSGM